ncbi:aldehyde dehydrogenase family protein [Shigella sonnei]
MQITVAPMSVPVQHPMYIDGQFVTWRGDASINVVNPATEAVISRIPDGQAEDARKAIDAAERARTGMGSVACY